MAARGGRPNRKGNTVTANTRSDEDAYDFDRPTPVAGLDHDSDGILRRFVAGMQSILHRDADNLRVPTREEEEADGHLLETTGGAWSARCVSWIRDDDGSHLLVVSAREGGWDGSDPGLTVGTVFGPLRAQDVAALRARRLEVMAWHALAAAHPERVDCHFHADVDLGDGQSACPSETAVAWQACACGDYEAHGRVAAERRSARWLADATKAVDEVNACAAAEEAAVEGLADWERELLSPSSTS